MQRTSSFLLLVASSSFQCQFQPWWQSSIFDQATIKGIPENLTPLSDQQTLRFFFEKSKGLEKIIRKILVIVDS